MRTTKKEFKFLSLCFEKPELWTVDFQPIDPVIKWCIGKIHKLRDRYHKYPNLDTFLDYIDGKCESQQFSYIKKEIKKNKLDAQFVEEEILTEVEEQKIRKAMQDATDLLDKGELTPAKARLVSGVSMIYSPPFDYFSSKSKRIKVESIPTGYKVFDKRLKGYGICRGFLGLILGPRGSGKTLTMLNFAGNAVLEGYNVLWLSFQDTVPNLTDRLDKIFKKYKKTKKKAKGGLVIQKLVAGRHTVADCATYIAIFKPDLVMVDYIDIINPGATEGARFGIMDVATGLQGLSDVYRCGIWAGKQSHGGTKFMIDRDVVTEDSSECKAVAQIADVSITMNQTREEREAKQIRLILDKNKEGPDGITGHFGIDYVKMKLEERE
jgi:replicative DNA helicase